MKASRSDRERQLCLRGSQAAVFAKLFAAKKLLVIFHHGKRKRSPLLRKKKHTFLLRSWSHKTNGISDEVAWSDWMREMNSGNQKRPMKKKLSATQSEELLKLLQARFEKNMNRHEGYEWSKVEARLASQPQKLWSLFQMEETGGEPDVVGMDKKTGEYIFYDCVAESPKGRRSLCYDQEAWESRKANKPKDSAIGMATEMGIELLDEDQYRALQKLGVSDEKTSSWIVTPTDIREKGGALFCDYRFGHVFVYHNGAESYYAARGFRGVLRG